MKSLTASVIHPERKSIERSRHSDSNRYDKLLFRIQLLELADARFALIDCWLTIGSFESMKFINDGIEQLFERRVSFRIALVTAVFKLVILQRKSVCHN